MNAEIIERKVAKTQGRKVVFRNVCEITCRFGRRLFDADIVGETVA